MGDVSSKVRNLRRSSWASMIQNQISSGLTVKEWCKQNGISKKTFYYRRSRVQEMLLDAAETPTFTELAPPALTEVPALPEIPLKEVSTRVEDAPQSGEFIPQITISVNGLTIALDQNTPMQLMADVLGVICNA